MEPAERFAYLMGIIDRWTDDAPDKNAGAFRYLKEGLWVREIVVTPGCSISVAQMKTYLATAVLEIYPFNTSAKVSYRDIQRFLSGEAVKKYSFDFKGLERCFSLEENRRAARESRLCKELAEKVEDWENVSLYLLERLQRLFRIRLGQYWQMCDPDAGRFPERAGERLKWKQRTGRGEEGGEDAAGEWEEDGALLAKKQNKYVECLMALALHEIFVREYGQRYELLFQEAEERRKVIGETREATVSYAQRYAHGNEEEREELLREYGIQAQEVQEYVKWFAAYMALQMLCMEHIIGVEAEIQMIMILETKNLESIKLNASLGWRLSKYLEVMEDRWTESFTRYNKNKVRIYRQLETDMENIFLRYMKQNDMSMRKVFSKAVKAYLRIVEKGRLGEEQLQELWESQCILAGPLWMVLLMKD